jgi:hypothetical protein
LVVCDECQQIYATKNHKCSGFYKSSRIDYSPDRKYYSPQKDLFHNSRNTFPFFITFDCETETIDTKLKYYCHSVTLFCICNKLAQKHLVWIEMV